MRIGIDISQLTYRNTGVANYLKHLIKNLVEEDRENEYILFYSSLRGKLDPNDVPSQKNVRLVRTFMPLKVLDLIWNKLHIVPIEMFTGPLDVFISSDWVEPPVRNAKKATIVYDLIVLKFPEESTPLIVETQKRKLNWVKKEIDAVLCISEATKKDVKELLGIDEKKLHIVYPGFSL